MNCGELLIIGGAEDKCLEGEVLNKFVELALRRSDGGIGILPTASEIPEEMSKQYIKIFRALGVDRVEVIKLDSREEADDPLMCEQLESLSALFITGGNQSRLSERIGQSKFHQALSKAWHQGMVIAGTSAGASIIGKHMIVAADTMLNDDKLKVEIGIGFGFLDGLLIDQHFSQRGRFDRLLSAIAVNKELLGIGIDENTAILVKDGLLKSMGNMKYWCLMAAKVIIFTSRPPIMEVKS